MVRKTRSKTTLPEPENVQMLTDEDRVVKKRSRSAVDTDTKDGPRKKPKNPGKKVLYLLIITSYLLADHDD